MKNFLPLIFIFLAYNINAQLECTTLFDFESLSTDFQYFGSSLDGQLTTVIPNPNPTGINTSSDVLSYVKAGDAQTWAGAFITPEMAEPINGSLVQQICVDVHWDHPGNLALKLELPQFDDPDNWIQTQEITAINEWSQVCFDLAQPSAEGNMLPAAGFVFYKIVLFPDFGVAGTGADVTSYMDNIVLKSSNEVNIYNVTFSVNMAGLSGFGNVYISGTFNDWSGDANPLADPDGDGIWVTTLPLEQGVIEYKYTLDNWSGAEVFDGTDVCTKTTDDGYGNIFVNREYVISGDAGLNTVCYNSCYDCGGAVDITWNVNMTQETVSDDGVFLAGGPYFGHGVLRMTDDDGDGTYSITLERESGFTTDYTFTNGICLPDWSCKENIIGQSCAVPPFNDRNLPPAMEDTVVSTCFGQCTTDGTCDVAQLYNVTFNVDMSNETVAGQVFIMGNTINNWNPTATEMLDDDGDGIYSVTAMLLPGLHEYKYLNQDAVEDLMQGDVCTVTDPSGQFTNRLLILGEADTSLHAVYFSSCELSTSINELVIDNNLAEVFPSITQDFVQVKFNNPAKEQSIFIFDVTGRLQMEQRFDFRGNVTLDVTGLSKGIHFVQVSVGTKMMTKKIIVE